MIHAEHVRATYGDFVALDDLSLHVDEGARFGLLGPNGAGKTTLLACLTGLKPPAQGRITVGGIDVQRDPVAVRRLVGLVPQSLALVSSLSVRENLRIFGGLMGLRGRRLRARVEWGLALAQLEDHAKRRVQALSGGMQRRLNMACSLLHEPRVIICDEPTTGVDPQSRNHIFETVRGLQAEGATVIYTTHYMEEVEALCDRVAIVDRGRLVVEDTLERLVAQPHESRELQVRFAGPADPARALEALQAAGLEVQSVQLPPRTLEAVFLDRTGHALRES